MTGLSRDRVTVDLRGLGERLRAQAAARQIGTAAFVRHAVALQLDAATGVPIVPAPSSNDPVVKVTLRLTAGHADVLAARSRAADTSQGAYIAGLLDGHPPAPVPPDRAEAIAALVASTDVLARLASDINALTRFLKLAKGAEAQRYRDSLDRVSGEVYRHLHQAADLFRQIVPARPARFAASKMRRLSKPW